MKLSHDDLISHLAEVLDISENKAEQELSSWAEILKREIDGKGAHHVPGLGTFTYEDGGISFSPEDELAIEVNYKYAGMKPIEILPAYARKIEQEKEEEDPFAISEESEDRDKEEDVDAFDIPDDEAQDKKSDPEEEKEDFDEFINPDEVESAGIGDDADAFDSPEEEMEAEDKELFADQGESGDTDKEEEVDAFDIPDDEAQDKKSDPDEEKEDFDELVIPDEEKSAGAGDDASAFESPEEGMETEDKESADEFESFEDYTPWDIDDPEGIENVTEAESEKDENAESSKSAKSEDPFHAGIIGKPSGKKEEPVKKRKPAATGKKNESRVWLIPIAAAIILAVMLFLHFQDQILSRIFTSDQIVSEEPAIIIADEDEEEMEEVDQVPPPHEIEASEVAAETETTSPYGLMGPEDEVLTGSYSIVLHSIVSQTRAQIEKEKLLEEDYKVTLWQARLPDGRTTWRIGVGQFETVSGAEAAVSRLPEPYRSNNFIIRIR